MRRIEKKRFQFDRRAKRTRGGIFGTPERPRLSVHRSLSHMYAQVIDDTTGKTVVSISTRGKDAGTKYGGNKEAAKIVGKALATAAMAKGVTQVVFDRSGYRYHGRVQALADAAREAGLKF